MMQLAVVSNEAVQTNPRWIASLLFHARRINDC